MVEGIEGVSRPRETLRHVRVAPDVLPQAVHKRHRAPGRACGLPDLRKNVKPVEGLP